jgi:hypothetical protein
MKTALDGTTFSEYHVQKQTSGIIFSAFYIVLSRGGFLIKPEITPIEPDLGNASAGTREKRY